MPTLRIVSVNDVYSLENLPRLATLLERVRSEGAHDALVVVLAGDFLAPSLLSSLDAGRGMVDCLNALRVTHVVLGNHEDDLEPQELRARLAELSSVCLGTNVRSGLDLPRSDVVEVGEGISVGLVGVVMHDPTVYRAKPFGGVDLAPANDAAIEEAARLFASGCAAVVPITHQAMADDRALAEAQRTPPFPVIVGGHEHTAALEQVSGTWIVKAGTEATHAVITDLTWDAPGDAPKVTARLEAVAPYAEDPELRARVDMHMTRVRELATTTLLRVRGEPLSSVGTRSRQTSIGTLICSRIRDALGADLCLFNGGGIRASRTYPERFTYGDVEAEVPFDNEVVVVTMQGRVVRDAVAASRAKAPAESGAFLQVDDGVVVEGTEVVAIGNRPIELDREYAVAIVRVLLLGLDRVEPLVRWAEEHPERVPPSGSGREPKLLLVQSFAMEIWRELGGFDAVDLDKDDRVTVHEVAEAVARAHPSQAPSPMLAELVVRAIDADADHVISRKDAESVLTTAAPRRVEIEDPEPT